VSPGERAMEPRVAAVRWGNLVVTLALSVGAQGE
jgi:hypothetical protein